MQEAQRRRPGTTAGRTLENSRDANVFGNRNKHQLYLISDTTPQKNHTHAHTHALFIWASIIVPVALIADQDVGQFQRSGLKIQLKMFGWAEVKWKDIFRRYAMFDPGMTFRTTAVPSCGHTHSESLWTCTSRSRFISIYYLQLDWLFSG